MNRVIPSLIFLFVFFLIDYYLFQAVKLSFKNISISTQKVISYIYWSIPVLAISASILGFVVFPEYISYKVRNFIAAGIFIFYISKFLAIVVLFIGDITRGIQYVYQLVFGNKSTNVEGQKVVENAIPRSEFLAKSALAVGGLHFGAMAYGIISGAHDYRIRKVPLVLKNLPKAFEGMTIAQISDVHSGSFFNKTAVQGGVDMLMAQKPDMAFFTGDLVNNEAKEFVDYFDVFKKIQAPLGVYSTLGNHDYGDYVPWDSVEKKMKNLDTLKEAHKLMGWNLLLDEHKKIKVDNEEIGVLGIQNWGLGGFAKYGDLSKAMAGTEDLSTKLLLSHDPSHWRAQVLDKTDIDAAFAGHTHGMQYGVEIGKIKFSPVQLRYKEWAGLYEENNQKLYVNRGYGYLGYPGRLGILPEITIFELKRA